MTVMGLGALEEEPRELPDGRYPVCYEGVQIGLLYLSGRPVLDRSYLLTEDAADLGTSGKRRYSKRQYE